MEDVKKNLLSWLGLVKNSLDTKDSWTEIPNVGTFENLSPYIDDVDLDSKEITITFKYDNWKDSLSGKFMRELNELIKVNFNLETHLVDDPNHDYYFQYPQLYFNWDNNLDNYQSRITIDKGKEDHVWVNTHPSVTIMCKPDLEEVLYCIYGQIKKSREDNGGEFEKMPCEQNVTKL